MSKKEPKLRKVKTCGNCRHEEFGFFSSPHQYHCHFHERDFDDLLEDDEIAWEHVCENWSAKDE